MYKKLLIGLLLICNVFVLSACGSGIPKDPPNIEGLIYQINESTILVIEDIDHVNMTQEEWQGKPAYSTRINEDAKILDEEGNTLQLTDLQIGDRVAVWTTGVVMESYPMQVIAVTIVRK